jgi:hypothetical protein
MGIPSQNASLKQKSHQATFRWDEFIMLNGSIKYPLIYSCGGRGASSAQTMAVILTALHGRWHIGHTECNTPSWGSAFPGRRNDVCGDPGERLVHFCGFRRPPRNPWRNLSRGAACGIRKRQQKGLTEGLGTAFPQKGVPN